VEHFLTRQRIADAYSKAKKLLRVLLRNSYHFKLDNRYVYDYIYVISLLRLQIRRNLSMRLINDQFW